VDTGGAAIDGYRIERSDASGMVWTPIVADTESTDTAYIDADIVPGAAYQYRVYAINDEGTGAEYDTSNTVEPGTEVFVSGWDTTAISDDSSEENQVVLPLQGCGVEDYDFRVYWGDGTWEVVSTGGALLHTYDNPGSYVVSITGTIKGFSFDGSGDRLKLRQVSNWGSLGLGNCGGYFSGAEYVTVPATDEPDLSGVTTLANTFNNADSFNSDITNWDTSAVEDFSGMFANTEIFSLPLSSLNTASATSMAGMFNNAASFNSVLEPTGGGWDVVGVEDMSSMFSDAALFNQDISNWDTRTVQNMNGMFASTPAFNQPIGGWDTGAVTSMVNMFLGAAEFDQDIGSWDIADVTDMSGMFEDSSGLSTPNYNALLTGWAGQTVQRNVPFFAGPSQYSAGTPTDARATLTGAPNTWTITDAGQSAVPNAPTNVQAVGGDDKITVTWDAAASPSEITKYTATASPGGANCEALGAATFTCQITSGVANGNTYDVTVVAWNGSGAGLTSSPPVSVEVNPTAPVVDVMPVVTGSAIAGQQLSVNDGTWTSESPISGYSYQWQYCSSGSCTGGGTNISGATSSTYVIDSSMVGRVIRAKVSATNSVGTSTVATGVTSAVVAGVPGAPASATAQPLAGSAKVTWTAPASSGGSAITGYNVYRASSTLSYTDWASIATPGNVLTYTDSTVTNGVGYRYRVYAINAVGTGSAYAETDIVTPSADLFISTWKTDNTDGGSTDRQVQLPLVNPADRAGASYNFTVYWGDGSSDEVTSWDDSDALHTYAEAGTYTVTIEGTITGFALPWTERLKLLDVSNWGPLAFTANSEGVFQGASNFNISATDVPGTSAVQQMPQMFYLASSLNADLSGWDTSEVVNMENMFAGATAFNGALTPTDGGWDTAKVFTMGSMFNGATAFNQDISGWDTSKVESMSSMFHGAAAFNQNISSWDTSLVSNMSGMFDGATAYNQPMPSAVGAWNTSGVTSMERMFQSATAFNQDISSWNTASVTNMASMFKGATAFDQDISSWNVTALAENWGVGGAADMFEGVTLSTPNYNALLVGWGGQNVNSGISFDGGGSKYSAGPPTAARAVLADAPNSWSITDGGASDAPGAPTNVTGVPQNTAVAVSWDAAPVPGVNPVTSYTVTALAGGVPVDPAKTCTTAALTCTVAGLTNSTAYTFTVTATNLDGTGPASASSAAVTPAATAPGAPTGVSAQPLKGSAKLLWTAPTSDGGSAITGYLIEQCDSGGIVCSTIVADTESTDTSELVSGLTNDTGYTFKVSAINAVDTGSVSELSDVVTPSADLFISTWKTDNDGSAPEMVVLPLADGEFGGVTNEYNFTAYWGDGTSTPVTNAAAGTHTYAVAGTYTVSIVGTIKGFRFANDGDRLKLTDISNWGSLNLGNGGDYFYGAANFNATATDAPDLAGTTSLARTFREATSFNANISNWNTLAVTDVAEMFDAYDVEAPSSFNQPLTTTDGGWNTSNMTDMGSMFRKASAFTGEGLSTWDTSNAQRMNGMFRDASSFNADLSGWDTADVTVMGFMFGGAAQFNADLGEWDTGSVTELADMFRGATAFNSDISGWDTSSATDMGHMFEGASTFNQNLGEWNVSSLASDGDSNFGAENMLDGTALSTANYDALLVGWSGQTVRSGIHLGVGAVQYSAGAPTTARAVLTDSPNGWSISDGGQSAVPGAPTNVAGTGANNRINVTWGAADAPSGSPVTSYTATASPGGATCTTPDGSTLACSITGLVNGDSYTVAVVATNASGPGLTSSPSSPITVNPYGPANTSVPTISGIAITGQTFTSTDGTWTGDPSPTFGYQWQRCATSDCASPTDISGATSSSYVATNDDVSSYLRLAVTGTNSVSSTTAYSTPSAAISGIAPVNTVAPVLSGTNVTGQTLSVTNGTWTGEPAPTFGYQWRTCTTADCTGGTIADIGGATSA
ncbi:MAG: BspA family leucine-rich repeat surface protein, partial [Candidatus Nanopelagicales bacterium]